VSAPADDLRAPEALRDPHPFFHRLRAHDPVHWSESAHAWILTGHAEVSSAFHDGDRLSSDRMTPLEARLAPDEKRAMAATFELLRGWMVFRDPPDHTRLRAPVRKALSPRQVAKLAPRIRALAHELADQMARAGRCELVQSFAFPLPAIVIAELLGVPATDRERFKTWATKLGAIVFGALDAPSRHALAAEGAAEFTDYFHALVRRRGRDPGDDLISRVLAARGGADGLRDEEIAGACTLLLFAGHETTTGLIANGMATLLARPEALARLRGDPALLPSAVEEMLRYEGPVRAMVRQVAVTHERGGHDLAAGDRVYLAVAAANRDPAVFRDPDRFDVARSPNPHLSFGLGLHFCLGANLARAEARIALGVLLERFPSLRLARPVVWGGTPIGRGVAGVELELD
jgi:cytochrome P450